MASPKICWVCCPLLSFGLQTAFRVKCKKFPWVPNFTCLRRNVSILFLRLLPLHLGCSSSSPGSVLAFWPPFKYLSSFLLSELPYLPPPFCTTRHSLMSRRFYSPYKPSDNRCNYFSLQGVTRAKRVLKGSALCLHVNEVVVKRVVRFSWCSVWRYKARTTNVAFT